MIKKWIYGVFAVALFMLLYSRVNQVFSWKDTAGSYYSSTDTFYDELEKDTVEVLFLGSSHCYCTVNNSLIWERTGIPSFSMSISGQDLASSYYCLQEALKTQKPKVVMLELYGVCFDGYGVESNLYRNTLFYKYSLNHARAIRDLVPREQQQDYYWKWPILHTRYAELKEQDFRFLNEYTYLGFEAGFTTGYAEPITALEVEPVESLGENREKWLMKLIQLAEEQDISLCFFVSPMAADAYHQGCIRRAELVGKEHGIETLNFIQLAEEIDLNEDTDFFDNTHTNYFGACKVSAYLADYLAENYELSDGRGDERYSLWDRDLQVRKHEAFGYRLEQITSLDSYLSEIDSCEDLTVFLYAAGDYLPEYGSLDTLFPQWNLEMLQYGGAQDWVIRNREVERTHYGSEYIDIFELKQDNGAAAKASVGTGTSEGAAAKASVGTGKSEDAAAKASVGTGKSQGAAERKGKSRPLDVVMNCHEGKPSLALDGVPYNILDKGVTIVVYDEVLEQVISRVGVQKDSFQLLQRDF